MDDRILINPENRFLASSGANDFSLYGAPSDPQFLSRAAAPQADAAAGAPLLPGQPSDSAARSTENPAPTGPMDPAAAPVADHPAAAPTAILQSLEPAVLGGGFGAPLLEVPQQGGGIVSIPAAPRPQALADAPAQPGPPPASDPAPAPSSFADAAGAPQAPFGGLVPAIASVQEGVDLRVSEAADGAGDAVAGVQDLLGPDPAGGVATLVSLVSISDVLFVPVTEDGAAPAGTVLDLLAADTVTATVGEALDGDAVVGVAISAASAEEDADAATSQASAVDPIETDAEGAAAPVDLPIDPPDDGSIPLPDMPHTDLPGGI